MSFADEIAQKRRETATLQASHDNHQQNIDAIKGNGVEVVEALHGTAKTEDIQHIIQELRQIQLDTLMSAQQQAHSVSKPTVILTDQTDLGDKLIAIGDKISETITKLDSGNNDLEEINQLKQLNKVFQDYIKAEKVQSISSDKANKALVTAIKSLDMSPVVNVPEPHVAVTTQHIDLQPLQDTIKEYFKQPDTDETIDLECYHAQDIDNTNPKVQYIGFINSQGNWYIVENDINNNSLRYVFGESDYSNAFNRAASYSYSLLNEAINALSA